MIYVENYGGHDVYLNGEGRFLTTVGSEVVVRDSLRSLRKKIDAIPDSIRAIVAQDFYIPPTVVNIVRRNATGNYVTDQGNQVKDGRFGTSLLVYDADILERLRDICARGRALKAEFDGILGREAKILK